MRSDRFTIKAQEILSATEKTATNYGHQQIEPEHVLQAIVSLDGSIGRTLIQKTGAQPEQLQSALEDRLKGLPTVSGSGVDIYISAQTKKLLAYSFVIIIKSRPIYS